MQKELLTLIQKGFPITKRPFANIADKLGSSEEDVISLYSKLKKDKIIRQTSAIFDTKSLGYESSLVAFKVKDIEKVANSVNSHPGVSHNYERDNEYNLWFTIAVPPDSKLGLKRTVEILANENNVDEFIILPTQKLFKISVQLDLKGDREKRQKQKKAKKIAMKLEPIHFEIIKELQKDIKAISEPYDKLIKKIGIDYETLELEAKHFKDAGIMRRFASILYHRKVGFTSNAMVVWKVPLDRAEELGEVMASFSAVSHCYLRPIFPTWPYSLFSMIHATSDGEIETVVKEISKEIDVKEYSYLYSTREFKKVRIEYFSDEFNKWELMHS